MKAFSALALLAVGCAQGHPASPEAGDGREEAPARFSLESARPLLVDLNGDGTPDVIARSTSRDGYVAIDGASGRELWHTPATKDHDTGGFAYIDGARLISVGQYIATVFDLSSGRFVRQIDLEGSPQLGCDAPPGKARILVGDGTVLAFGVEGGDLSREPRDAPCVELRSDLAERRIVTERRYRPATFLPADVPAVACGSWSVMHIGSGEGFELPDACAQLGLEPESEPLRDITPDAVVKTDRGALVLGEKRRGHPLPVLALVSEGKLVWSVSPPVESDGSPRRVAFDRGEVALLYDDAKGAHLFSWDIATGTPILDVVLARRAKWIDAGRNEWLVTGESIAFGVAESNGEIRPIAGGREAAQPEWSPGMPVPRGYVAETRSTPDWGSVAGGLGVFGGTMALNGVLYAAVDDKRLWPLLVPGVGPFIAFGTLPSPDQGVATGLVLDAAAQAFGILWFSFGAATKTTKLAPVTTSLGPGTVQLRVTF